MIWEKIAKVVEDVYGMEVEWTDRECQYFICPYCGEPIYRSDWKAKDYMLDNLTSSLLFCPVCEMLIVNEEGDE